MAPNILDPVAKKTESEESIIRSRTTANKETNGLTSSNVSHDSHKTAESSSEEAEVFKPQIRWPDLIAQVFIHVGSLYGLYYLITLQAKLYTYIWCESFAEKLAIRRKINFPTNFSRRTSLHDRNRHHCRWANGKLSKENEIQFPFMGIAGAHRLWSHKSYKARWPLRALLVFLFTIAGQVSGQKCLLIGAMFHSRTVKRQCCLVLCSWAKAEQKGMTELTLYDPRASVRWHERMNNFSRKFVPEKLKRTLGVFFLWEEFVNF